MEAAPTYFNYRRRVLADVLEECFSDPLAAAICGGSNIMLGLPPSRLPFMVLSQYLFSYLKDGAFYVRGGAQEFADAMVEGIRKQGSEVLLGSAVERIVLDHGRVVGVELAGGHRVSADIVVSNAAAPNTFLELVGEDHLPDKLLGRLRSLRTSTSAAMILGATGAAVDGNGLSHTVLLHRTPDLEGEFRRMYEGDGANSLGAFFPSIVDDSLAPGDEQIFTALCYRPYDIGTSWAEEQQRLRELIIDRIDGLLPGFREGLLFSMDATPETLETFTGNTGGAVFGWDSTLDQMGSKRPAQRTPVEGLYLAGHWTRPGAGSLRATVSGIHASYMVLDDSGLGDPEARFRHENVPPAE